MTHPDFRALLARARQKFHEYEMDAEGYAPYEHREFMREIDAALSAPQQRAPSDEDILYLAQSLKLYAIQAVEQGPIIYDIERQALLDLVRLALTRYGAQAVPQQGPTLDDISELCDEFNFPLGEDEAGSTLCQAIRLWEMANALITRYGAQAVPVAVAERLPGEGDCDAEGRCWWYMAAHTTGIFRQSSTWCLGKRVAEDFSIWTHWLPHWALPLPEAQA